MCVLAFAWKAHPRWRLVLAGNRDEAHARPAAPLGRWADAPRVIGGRDLASGGGWLGVSEDGRLAVVTNVRGHGLPSPDAPSRGLLVQHVLTGEGAFADPKGADLSLFNPMNLVTVHGEEAAFFTNRPRVEHRPLVPGVYGMANGGLDDGWPKTDRLKGFLSDWLGSGEDDADGLWNALMDEARPPDGRLPATGLGLERERIASSIFIRNETYGTRCSTVVLVDAGGDGLIAERRFDPDGRPSGETRLAFEWPI